MLLQLLLNKIGHCTLDCNPPAAADHIIPDHEPKVNTTLTRSMAVSTDRPSLCQCCRCLLRHFGVFMVEVVPQHLTPHRIITMLLHIRTPQQQPDTGCHHSNRSTHHSAL